MKNKEHIKILIVGICIIISFAVIFTIVLKIQNRNYAKILNSKINLYIEEIKKVSPEVTDEEIIKILNSEGVAESDFLKTYEFNEKIPSVKMIDDAMTEALMIDIVFLFIFGICFIFITLKYLVRQEKKIRDINDYIEEVNRGNYTLNIEDNGEGELPKLRNELYKTTILLREAAENSQNESANLSNSLADISHQLKTPLTSIRIMLDNIEDDPDMSSNVREDFIKEISKQINWISSLVISLLKISKFDAGVIKMDSKKINAKNFIETIVDNLSIMAEIKDVNIITEVDENAEFEADFKWQQEAITNILKNAIEHSRQNSKVYISVEDNSLFLKIKIKDEGSGIDKKDIKHIFERFYKAEGSSDDSIGIGLALAKTIIEQNNGTISVSSKVNEGTIFEVKYIKF